MAELCARGFATAAGGAAEPAPKVDPVSLLATVRIFYTCLIEAHLCSASLLQ